MLAFLRRSEMREHDPAIDGGASMLVWRLFTSKRAAEPPPPPRALERRREERIPVFREAVLAIEDFYSIRAVIVDVSPRGARVQFANRIDLPFRIGVSAPSLKLNCRARVVWQHDGAAGLEFLDGARAVL